MGVRRRKSTTKWQSWEEACEKLNSICRGADIGFSKMARFH